MKYVVFEENANVICWPLFIVYMNIIFFQIDIFKIKTAKEEAMCPTPSSRASQNHVYILKTLWRQRVWHPGSQKRKKNLFTQLRAMATVATLHRSRWRIKCGLEMEEIKCEGWWWKLPLSRGRKERRAANVNRWSNPIGRPSVGEKKWIGAQRNQPWPQVAVLSSFVLFTVGRSKDGW